MKKTTIYILFLALVYTLLPAQPKYFNQIYQADSISMGSVAVGVTPTGYLVAGDFNGAAGYSATYLRKINLRRNRMDTNFRRGSTIQRNDIWQLHDTSARRQ